MFFGDFPDFFSFLVDEIVIFDRRTLLTSRRGDANDQKARRGEREHVLRNPIALGRESERWWWWWIFWWPSARVRCLQLPRPLFFFSLSSSLMLACVSMWHRRKEIVKWQQLFNDFRRQFFLFFLQSACQTFARKNREDFVSNLGFFKNVLFHSQTLFFSFLNEKKGDLGWPSYVSGVSFSDLIYLFSSFPCANVMTR